MLPENAMELTRHLSEKEFACVALFCDADRLDLTRFGWRPDPRRLFTSHAKDLAFERESL
jgi:hypothetical protein